MNSLTKATPYTSTLSEMIRNWADLSPMQFIRIANKVEALEAVVKMMDELPALRSDYIGVDGIEIDEITGIPTEHYDNIIEAIATLHEQLK